MRIFDKYWGCHQIPERSFFYRGYQFPVCARCTGIILGETISVITLFFGMKFYLSMCILFMMPMIFDGVIQYKSRYSSTNVKRIITGILFGIGFIQILYSSP